MSAALVISDDLDVTDDPHGLRRRMATLGLMNKDVAEALGVSPNTVTRALNSEKPSTARPRIVAYLDSLERERGEVPAPRPLPQAARELARLVGDRSLGDVRIEYIGDGRVTRLVAMLGDSNLTPAEVEQAIREWREGHTSK